MKYAIGEIFLIVAGVILAMQINNWNESRKNTIANDQLLFQVKEEMLQNGEIFDRDKSYRDTIPLVYTEFVKELSKADSEVNTQKLEKIIRTLFRTTAYSFPQNSLMSYIAESKNDNTHLNREIMRLHSHMTELELISKRGFDLKFENFYSGFGDDVDVSSLSIKSFKTIKSLDFRNKMIMNGYVEEEITTKFDLTRNQQILVDSLIIDHLKLPLQN